LSQLNVDGFPIEYKQQSRVSRRRRQKVKSSVGYCVFCKNNGRERKCRRHILYFHFVPGEAKDVYNSHVLKDDDGK